MDDDALNMHNWGYYEPTFKGVHFALQLMSGTDQPDTKPFLQSRDHPVILGSNTPFNPRDCVVTEAPMPMDYGRDGWMNQRDKFLNMLPPYPAYRMLPETSTAHPLPVLQPLDLSTDERAVCIEDPVGKKEGGQSKKRQGGSIPKAPKPVKARKPRENSNTWGQRTKPVRRSMDVVINGIDMDISGIPIPVCSCTGTHQQCYRWGCGGWQSACCTTNLSMYPLPMSTKRRGARIAGRKMSQGAFKKVLEKLAGEGYNFANSIDLRTHWARHGTNKFVTIR